MIVIGLTGSIGMGKSTVGAMLEELGIPVHESDLAVHELLQPGAEGYLAVAAAFPYFDYAEIYGPRDKQGQRAIDRGALGRIVFADDEARKRLESILHPLVRAAQDKFIRDQKRAGRDIVALDIPLLFETGAEDRVDVILVTDAPYHVQKARVLERAGMTAEKFEAILSKQMPNAEKCARADYVVHTGLGLAQTMKELKLIISALRED